VRHALLCFTLAALALPAPAAASPFQRSILQDDAQLLSRGADVRERTLDELKGLGVDVVKMTISWRELAPRGRRKPSGLNAEDPAAYAGWERYDAAIASARRRQLEVLLQVTGPAPDWASVGRSEPAGASRPDAAEFGRFARAVGTRYSGSYQGLPRVASWSIWNEPNLPRFLLPQRSSDRRRTPLSPAIYRRLYLAAHAGLSASGHERDTILFGELLPVGRSSTGVRSSLRPLEFLREMLCLDRRYRPLRGRAARARGCQGFRSLPSSGLAYHPYATGGRAPTTRPPHPDDATIGQLSRVVRALDRLGRRGRIARGLTLYLTEFGFQTDPPDRLQTPIRRVDDFLAESEYLAYRNPRVGSWSQYPLIDDAANGTGLARFSGFQSGLRFANGQAKPDIYQGYRLPLHVRRISSLRIEVFGGARNADGGGGGAVVESRLGRAPFTPVANGAVRLGPRGYFRAFFSVPDAARREFRISSAGVSSPVVRARRP